MELWQYVVIFIGGFVAGGINSLAGYGSLITLAILMDVMGLSPVVANATNRVNVAANGIAGSAAFYKNGKLRLDRNTWIIILIVIVGSLFGSYLATIISDENFRNIYRVLLFLVAFLLVINPKRWLIEKSFDKTINWWLLTPILLLLGFYGGLIQAGLGMFVLATLVLLVGRELIEANAIKMFIILIYSILVIAIFHYKGLIDWKAGLMLSVSQALGSYIVAHYASRFPQANKWAYYLLIVLVAIILSRELYLLYQ